MIASPPAFADGGQGGGSSAGGTSSPPGTAGTSSATGAGGAGGPADTSFGSGGGGGGAGTTGGVGGQGSQAGGTAGGPGGATPGASGGNGTAGTGAGGQGGGGGGGGAHGAIVSTSGSTNSGAILGGAGGNGADSTTGSGFSGGGGGGGAGGYGVVVNGGGLTYTNSSTIAGGIGGNGGTGISQSASITGDGGNGGDGGFGVDFTGSGTLTNNGTITGGNGGSGGSQVGGFASPGNGGAGGAGINGNTLTITNTGTITGGNGGGSTGTTGAGGAGISGSDLTITTAGSIAGGLGGDGVTQANAITFTGGTNSLALQSGYSITGNVVGTGNDTLALGGTANATFDVSNIGAAAQYQGFSTFQKIGTSTWTLTNTTTAVTPWTISAGVLNASSDAALGDTGGTLTLNGGTLQFGAAFNMPSRNISLGASGGTFDTNGFTIAIGAGIAGSGGLTKNGAGTLNLGAPNSYTGGTTVNAGTLVVVSGASLASTGAITVNGGTLDFDGNTQTVSSISGTGGSISLGPAGSTNGLTVNQNSNTSYNGNISGAGTFTKTGTGTLILNGANTFSGPTTVSGGTLEIGDASHTSASLTSNVTIGASGTLMGHGTFAGGVTNTAGGTIAPGGSIGTLTVASYTQGAGSTLQIEVSPSAASKLNVTGAASLNGTLALIYDPGVYSSATFAIVHAGSITGTFATVNASGSVPTNVSQAVTYTGTDVNLVLTGSSTLVVRPTNDTIFSSLNTSVLLGGQQANTMLLGHLSDNHSGTGSDTIETALASTNPTQLAFNGGAMHLNDAVAQLPDAMAQFGGWFRAVGNFASLSSASVPGVDTQGGGFMAGLDRPIAPNLTAGIAAGYSHTNLSQHDSENGTLDTPRIAAYGSYAMGPWAFDATVGYAYDHVSEKRPLAGIGTASSSHDAHEATGAAQASYRFDYAGFAIMPNAGLAYVHLFDGGLTESGTPGFNLDVMHRNSDSLRPFIGVSASEPITTSGMRLVPEADIRYSHELFATAPSLVFVGGGNFAVNGITPSHDLLTLGGGVTAAMSDRLDLFADYHATLPTGNYWQQTISAGARYKF